MRLPRSGRGRLPALATIAAAAIGVAALAQHSPVLHATPLAGDSVTALARPPISTGAVARLEDLSDAFATVAARVKPSVVYITARQEARQVAGQPTDLDPRRRRNVVHERVETHFHFA